MKNDPLENAALETATPTNEAASNGDVGDHPTSQQHTTDATTLSTIVGTHLQSHPGFDPGQHAVNTDGTPKLKADGSYARKRGRKSGSSLPSKSDSKTENSQSETVADDMPRISPEEAARQSANMVINAAVWICGEEIGKPIDKSEAEGLKISFINYYESRGVPNIPPEIGLFVALASYIAPRIQKSDSAKSKFSRAVQWMREKIGQ